MPQGPISTNDVAVAAAYAPSNFKNFSAATAGAQIKTGAGVFKGISVNTVGSSSSITLYDGTSTSGAKIGDFSTTAQGVVPQNIAFTTGLFAVVTVTQDVTVLYQ